jgi:hypothetical protein
MAPTFVCEGCKAGEHGLCTGGTWCDCQCRPPDPEARR